MTHSVHRMKKKHVRKQKKVTRERIYFFPWIDENFLEFWKPASHRSFNEQHIGDRVLFSNDMSRQKKMKKAEKCLQDILRAKLCKGAWEMSVVYGNLRINKFCEKK